MPKTVISFGELLWDVFPTGEVLGGAPSNFAYRMNSFGHEAWLVTRLGKDDRGKRAADQIRAKGLSIDYIQWDETHPTGTVPVELDSAGNPTFNILPDVAYDYIEVTPELLALAAMADCICFGTVAQRMPASRATLQAIVDAAEGALKILDLNLRQGCYDQETITHSIKQAHVVKLNEGEVKCIARMYGLPEEPDRFASAAVEKFKLEVILVTLGPNGMIAANSKGEFARRMGHKVEVVDTVGCGDAVTAGFAHCYLAGLPIEKCCAFGNAAGALVAQSRGGMTEIDPVKIAQLAELNFS